MQQNLGLFDYLFGESIDLRRDRDAKHIRRNTVDDQIESCWLLDRQIAWARTFEYFVYVRGSTPVEFEKAFAITHQSTGFHKLSLRDHGRQPLPQRELRNPLALAEQKPVRYHQDCPYVLSSQCSKRDLDFFRAARLHTYECHS